MRIVSLTEQVEVRIPTTTMESVINGEPSVRLSQIPKLVPLRWRDQHQRFG